MESTNKVLQAILTKTVQQNHKDWADRLLESLWAYRITWRSTTRFSSYEMVYGKKVMFPIEFQIKTFKTTTDLNLELTEAQKQRIAQLNELDDIRQEAFQQTDLVQQQRATWHDKFIKKKEFALGDWALLFDSRFKNFQVKLTTRWLGPYEVVSVSENGAIKIKTIDDHNISFLVNGHRLKLYTKPVSQEDFISKISTEEMEIMQEGESIPKSFS